MIGLGHPKACLSAKQLLLERFAGELALVAAESRFVHLALAAATFLGQGAEAFELALPPCDLPLVTGDLRIDLSDPSRRFIHLGLGAVETGAGNSVIELPNSDPRRWDAGVALTQGGTYGKG